VNPHGHVGIDIQNDLYCVGWGVTLYSLTLTHIDVEVTHRPNGIADADRKLLNTGAETNFNVCVGASTSTISRFGERFRGVQYSLDGFLFAVPLMLMSLSTSVYIAHQ